MGVLSREQAKGFYDWLGARQNWQAFYENPAIEDVVVHGRFDNAQAVCEFGCGTGRMAERLLTDHLPTSATYLALDISATMARLAATRLKPWSNRARVLRTDGSPNIPARDGSFDRVVTTYVLDLLSDADIQEFIADARRVLGPGGLFCNVSLTFGQGPLSTAICALWQKIHDRQPALLGGCRPVEIGELIPGEFWRIGYQAVLTNYGICSEVVVAKRRA
jgi:ubiquinone/menaquinone biosynthesis C-methylase UbiE